MKNSKYDDNFLVDYSGNQNKLRKIDESGKSSGIGKLGFDSEMQLKRSSKRQVKFMKKQDDKENMVQPFEKP